MSDVNVTVIGNVGTDPGLATSGRGTEWTTFRLASTRRVRDPLSGEWTDGETQWFTVKLFRDRARMASMSLRKGDPVVVVGRLVHDEWEGERPHALPDGSQVTLPERRVQPVIEAQAVGVDATRGVVRFARLAPEREAERADEPAAPGDGGNRSDTGAGAGSGEASDTGSGTAPTTGAEALRDGKPAAVGA